ncbi:hypothetical protein [[Leptolyngbya] sp. PCC 7376]|uniref:hypothetical protein n=1 Tax=[Leptolyngbya] sp. PCC 7376 TaxID=111781 RepID=UPI0005A035B3|nr:hypothetical protein [[Leptolyngbya] sp. PCC 7376]
MTPKSAILLLLSCISAIAAVGCVFELGYGDPDFGFRTTQLILAASAPLTVISFVLAVIDARQANQE